MKEEKTVIFDLQETLVHLSSNTEGADLIIPIRKKGELLQVASSNPGGSALPALLEGHAAEAQTALRADTLL